MGAETQTADEKGSIPRNPIIVDLPPSFTAATIARLLNPAASLIEFQGFENRAIKYVQNGQEVQILTLELMNEVNELFRKSDSGVEIVQTWISGPNQSSTPEYVLCGKAGPYPFDQEALSFQAA